MSTVVSIWLSAPLCPSLCHFFENSSALVAGPHPKDCCSMIDFEWKPSVVLLGVFQSWSLVVSRGNIAQECAARDRTRSTLVGWRTGIDQPTLFQTCRRHLDQMKKWHDQQGNISFEWGNFVTIPAYIETASEFAWWLLFGLKMCECKEW